ncbi:PTS system mannose/fructose/sorbose family transporter subunit IID [Lacrimispora sp. JR3]|uniref:PTS system mannose/fructose/sorbose family transporter subunit IID n=1 Tax=Lacrimispora sinapis TaxID=3111456 RepID=UPI0037479E97
MSETRKNSILVLNKEEKKTMKSLFWRHMWIMQGINWVRMQGIAVAWIMQPFLRKLYKNDDQYWAAMKRHAVFFNTTPQMAPFILGLTLSMEEENAKNPEKFDIESINGIKVGLMGPFAGIGDSFFVGTFRIIATGLALGLSQQGSILGPIIFLVAYNIPSVIFRWFGGILGYKLGGNYIAKATQSGLIASITKSAAIMGLMMIGVMSAQSVNFSFAISPTIGGQVLNVQSYLDQILLGLIPVLSVLGCYKLLKKGANPLYIICGILVVSFVLAFFGIA